MAFATLIKVFFLTVVRVLSQDMASHFSLMKSLAKIKAGIGCYLPLENSGTKLNSLCSDRVLFLRNLLRYDLRSRCLGLFFTFYRLLFIDFYLLWSSYQIVMFTLRQTQDDMSKHRLEIHLEISIYTRPRWGRFL